MGNGVGSLPSAGAWARMGLLAWVAAFSSAGLPAQAPSGYLEAGIGRRQGDYGLATTNRLDLAYGAAGLATSSYDVNVAVPYLRVESQEGGKTIRTTGLGDVLVRGLRRILPETLGGQALDGGLAVKLPTAKKDKGLGTGLTDVGGFLAAHQRFGRIQFSASGGWIQSSSSKDAAGTPIRAGIYTAGAGLSYEGRRSKVSLTWLGQGSQYPGMPAPREVALELYQSLGYPFALGASFGAGLNDGAPRTRFGLSLSYRP
ncbi:hypothetical protein [Geothrix sp. 21YS21S-2]|uniref:hypothetical protein n=1 Tax=Geothrix sp. 21YS21S-2 TaxID=3068893 RepID=UPI0027BA2C2B|nr:hypothetical protein [Geothrix sp. 21YS21S-2]